MNAQDWAAWNTYQQQQALQQQQQKPTSLFDMARFLASMLALKQHLGRQGGTPLPPTMTMDGASAQPGASAPTAPPTAPTAGARPPPSSPTIPANANTQDVTPQWRGLNTNLPDSAFTPPPVPAAYNAAPLPAAPTMVPQQGIGPTYVPPAVAPWYQSNPLYSIGPPQTMVGARSPGAAAPAVRLPWPNNPLLTQ